MAEGLLQDYDPNSSISTGAQDVANAQGVAYTEVGKPEPLPEYKSYDAAAANTALAQNTNIKSGTEYVDQDRSTVQGQLSALLSQDSPYLSENRRQATEQAASRGLLNSSIAAGAGQRAAIQSALPIAQQDAQTYAQAQGRQQAADYGMEQVKGEAIVSGEIIKQQEAVKAQNQQLQNRFTALMEGANAQSQVWLGDLKNKYDTGMQELQGAQSLAIQREEISSARAQSIREQTSAVMQNYQISVENLMTDPDFLNLGATAVNNAINQMQNLAKNTINFIGSSSGVDLTPFVNTYLGNLSVR